MLHTTIISQLLVIYVRYQNPVVEYRISYVNYDLQSWISEIGGTIGLTLGISGLSLVEVVSDAFLVFLGCFFEQLACTS